VSVRSVRTAFAGLALVVLGAACGSGAAESGVNVKQVATDLTYGIPKPVPPAAPANTNPIPDDPLPVLRGVGPVKPSLPPVGPPPEVCPKAPPTVFPPAATTEITGDKPKAGEYLWKIEGKQKVSGIGQFGLPPFSRRQISDVKTTEQGYSFVVAEREQTFGSRYTVKSTYEVRKTGTVSGQEPAGLYLTRVERIHPTDKNGNTTFDPSPAILLLPTPTTIGAKIDSVGVDPTSLEVLRNTGTVTKRVRVDACGRPVDAFYVEGIQQFAGFDGNTTRRKFDYGIASALGGLPVVEHIESPCVDAGGACAKDSVDFRMDAHIGQLTPSRPR
jgi:hypothetical protein